MIDLLTYLKRMGGAYNTEDSALFFYALTRMKNYKTFVEFGTGMACTAFAVAYAMKENGEGKCVTFDNCENMGRYMKSEEGERTSYSQFINARAEELKIQNHFMLSIGDVNFQNVLIDNVDCVFSDFHCSIDAFEELMSWSLYSMNDYSSIFIDGTCDYEEGFYYTKLLVNMLNQKNIPKSFTKMYTEEQKIYAKKFVEDHNFSLTTIRKRDKGNLGQNGMCWIKIEPNNVRLE